MKPDRLLMHHQRHQWDSWFNISAVRDTADSQRTLWRLLAYFSAARKSTSVLSERQLIQYLLFKEIVESTKVLSETAQIPISNWIIHNSRKNENEINIKLGCVTQRKRKAIWWEKNWQKKSLATVLYNGTLNHLLYSSYKIYFNNFYDATILLSFRIFIHGS